MLIKDMLGNVRIDQVSSGYVMSGYFRIGQFGYVISGMVMLC
jgi:hypothetical protein